MVPCDPVLYLNDDYGIWQNPEEKNYRWPNLDLNVKRVWPYGNPLYYFPKYKV